MSPLVSLPKQLRDGIDLQSGADVIADLNAILTVLNGGIDAANISSTAGIPGTRLSNVNGSQIPTDRLANGAVTFAKLGALAIQDSTVITNGAITGNKLSAGTVGGQQLRIASTAWVPGNLGSVLSAGHDTGISAAGAIPLGVYFSQNSSLGVNAMLAMSIKTSTNNFIITVSQTTTWPGGAPSTPTFNLTGITITFVYLLLSST